MDRKLPDGTIWHEQFGSSDLVRLAAESFTSLVPVIIEGNRSLHLQISALGRELTERLNRGDERAAVEVFGLLDAALTLGKPARELENALQISFADMNSLTRSVAAVRALRHASPTLRELLSVAILPDTEGA